MSVNIGAARRKINKLHNIAKRGPTHGDVFFNFWSVAEAENSVYCKSKSWDCIMESVWTAGLVFAMDFMALGGRGCRQVCTYHWGDCIFGQNRWHTRKSVHFGVLLLSTGAAMRNTLQFNFYAHTLWLCFCINKKQILFVFCQCDQIEKFTNFLKVICRLQCGPSLEN